MRHLPMKPVLHRHTRVGAALALVAVVVAAAFAARAVVGTADAQQH